MILSISCKDPVKKRLSGMWKLDYVTIENQNPYIYEKIAWIDVCKETIYKFKIFIQDGTLTLSEDGEFLLSLNGFMVYKENSQFCRPVHDTVDLNISDKGLWFYIEEDQSIQFQPHSEDNYTCQIRNFDDDRISLNCPKKIKFTYQIGYLNSRTITTNSLQLKGTKLK